MMLHHFDHLYEDLDNFVSVILLEAVAYDHFNIVSKLS